MGLKYENPFEKPGLWLRGNIHTHTVHSDGHLTPEQHADRYREAGYGFLVVTDHGEYVDTRGLGGGGLTMIQGEELSAGRTAAGTLYHLVALGIREALPFPEADPTVSPQAVIDHVNGEGGIAILAHPYWSGLTHGEAAALEGFAAVEAYNYTCELLNDRGDAAAHWDHMLTARRMVNAVAVDDAHNRRLPQVPDDSFGGWVVARCSSRSEASILGAIRGGLYYSSSGPSIHGVEVGGGEVRVKCSPVRKIAFVSVPCLGDCIKAEGDSLTEASYEPAPRERYIRVQVTDSRGGRAWTNPIYVE